MQSEPLFGRSRREQLAALHSQAGSHRIAPSLPAGSERKEEEREDGRRRGRKGQEKENEKGKKEEGNSRNITGEYVYMLKLPPFFLLPFLVS